MANQKPKRKPALKTTPQAIREYEEYFALLMLERAMVMPGLPELLSSNAEQAKA
jgi:hypothetical protein